jgi:hypothetical protein
LRHVVWTWSGIEGWLRAPAELFSATVRRPASVLSVTTPIAPVTMRLRWGVTIRLRRIYA